MTAYSRPTTTPSAPSAAPSSTASSPSEANPSKANDASSGCSQPPSPAAYNTAPYSPTWPTSSPPTPAATQHHPSPDNQETERLPKPPNFQGFCLKRMKGFEPSTFAMAKRAMDPEPHR